MKLIKKVTAIVNLVAATVAITRGAEALTAGEFGQAAFSAFLFIVLVTAASVFWNGSKCTNRS